MEKNNTKIIDQYLSGELTEQAKKAFENKLQADPALQKEMESQKELYEAAQRLSLRNTVISVGKSYHSMQLLKWIIGGIAILAVAVGVYFSLKENNNEVKDDSHPKSEIIEKGNTKQESTAAFSNKSNAFDFLKEIYTKSKSKLSVKEDLLINSLPSETFTWKGNDSLYLSKNGVLVSIPEGALLQNGKAFKGKAIIEWQEALDGASIMKSGLSTMADSNLLETQGMFSFRAQTEDGELLDVDEETGIYVQFPVDEMKPGMQLYDGEYDKDSIINWVNPVPLEKIPVPVAMSDLDFYPVGYEDTLNKLKLSQRKEYRDSLYLACERIESSIVADAEEPLEEENRKESNLIPPININRSKKKERGIGGIKGSVFQKQNNQAVSNATIIAEIGSRFVAQTFSDSKGEFEFSSIKSGVYNLSIHKNSCDTLKINEVEVSAEKITFINENVLENCRFENSSFSSIPPSKVLAFWNEKFENTNLATREFEKRMVAIHETCDEHILKLYTNNLDRPMYYLDSISFQKGHASFESFFAERVGKVDVYNPHLKNLVEFYEKGIKELRQWMQAERIKEKEKEKAWDRKVNESNSKESVRTSNRNAQAFSEEASLNHEHVRKQLGLTQSFRITRNTAIVNVDRQVYAATRDRKTTKITDDGKTGTIKYNDFSLNIENHKNYNRLFVYLLPDKLNSYQRINHIKGKLDYPLNDLITYDIVVLGINETGYFFHEIKQINQGKYGAIQLTPISEDKFEKRIIELNENRLDEPMQISDELAWLKLEKENYKVQRIRAEKREFLERIRKVVFPCYELVPVY